MVHNRRGRMLLAMIILSGEVIAFFTELLLQGHLGAKPRTAICSVGGFRNRQVSFSKSIQLEQGKMDFVAQNICVSSGNWRRQGVAIFTHCQG